MKSPERRSKTTSSSTKRVVGTELRRSASRKSPVRASKQRRKVAGEGEAELGGLKPPSTVATISPPLSLPGHSSPCYQKFKLQLFPVDEVTRRGLEREKHNPYLELTMGTQKKISSVVKHLSVKWGNSSMAAGDLMLFPYTARVDNLENYTGCRWSLKDSGITVADVHSAIGRPALFRLRYGWLSKLEPKVGSAILNKENIFDGKRNFCNVVRCEPDPTDASLNQDRGEPVLSEKPVEDEVNNQSGKPYINIWDLSNISFGALLSEASAHANVNPVTCDSFDAAIFSLKAANQSTPVTQSIFDADETCNAFSFRKSTSSSSSKSVSAQFKNTPITSSVKNVDKNLLRLDNQITGEDGKDEQDGRSCVVRSSLTNLRGFLDNKITGEEDRRSCMVRSSITNLRGFLKNKDDGCQEEPMTSLQLHTNGLAGSNALDNSQHDTTNVVKEEPKLQLTPEAIHSESSQLWKLQMNWPDSLGPLECGTSFFKDTVGSDSIDLGALLANRVDEA